MIQYFRMRALGPVLSLWALYGCNTDKLPANRNAGDNQPSFGDQNTPDPFALNTLLSYWYDDYNQGLSTDYLNATFIENNGGDPTLTNAPAHEFYENVPYGPFARNILDVWRLNSTTSTPVAIFMHGGGFRRGDKTAVRPKDILTLLRAGISVVSINYRYALQDAAFDPQTVEVHGAADVRLDYVLRDCARAVQFVRYRATQWGLDAARVGAWGGSAGGGCAVWTGSIPDLADAKRTDPVLRESTRLIVAGHLTSQVTYNWPRWPELLKMDTEVVLRFFNDEDIRLTQMSRDEMNSGSGRKLGEILDFYAHINAGDADIFTRNLRDDLSGAQLTSSGELIHHPRGHVAIYEKCVAAGLRCEINTQIINSNYDGNVVDFLIERLNASQ